MFQECIHTPKRHKSRKKQVYMLCNKSNGELKLQCREILASDLSFHAIHLCKTLSWSVRNSYGANCLVFTHLQSALGVLGAWYKGCMRCVRRGMVKGPKHVFCKYICFKLENLSKYDLHINFVLSPPPPPTPNLAKR